MQIGRHVRWDSSNVRSQGFCSASLSRADMLKSAINGDNEAKGLRPLDPRRGLRPLDPAKPPAVGGSAPKPPKLPILEISGNIPKSHHRSFKIHPRILARIHILARICATKQSRTKSLATNIGNIPKNMPTNFQLKRLKLRLWLDIVERPENRVHKLTDSNGVPE